jgi:glutamyl-tRNA reductase
LRGLDLAAIDVANRTPVKAARLAASAGGRGYPLDDLPQLLTETDVVVTCTSGTGVLITEALAEQAVQQRGGRPLYILDLALPRNVDAAVGTVDGVTMVDLNALAGSKRDLSAVASVERSQHIIDAEAAAFVASRRAARVAPALSAMRSVASTAVESELDRLLRKVPTLDDRAQSEIVQSVQRIVDKVLHGPTVRARELAALPEGALYAEVMGRLFDQNTRQLDPEVLA